MLYRENYPTKFTNFLSISILKKTSIDRGQCQTPLLVSFGVWIPDYILGCVELGIMNRPNSLSPWGVTAPALSWFWLRDLKVGWKLVRSVSVSCLALSRITLGLLVDISSIKAVWNGFVCSSNRPWPAKANKCSRYCSGRKRLFYKENVQPSSTLYSGEGSKCCNTSRLLFRLGSHCSGSSSRKVDSNTAVLLWEGPEGWW